MRTRLTLACLVLLLLAPAAYPLAQRGSADGGWTHHGGDAGSTKYAPLDQITPANVGSLRIAWRRPAVSPDITAGRPKLVVPRNFRATPLMVDGMLFASNAIGLAEAIEPESGRTVWTQEVPPGELEGPGASRTLAYWRGDGGGRVFAVRGAYLYAIDPRSGKPITTFGAGGLVDLVAGLGNASTFRWSAPSPLVVRDVVIIGGQGWTDEGTQELIQIQAPLRACKRGAFIQDILGQPPAGIERLPVHHYPLAAQQRIESCQRSQGMHHVASLDAAHHRKPRLDVVSQCPGLSEGQPAGAVAG